jgi:predicted nucleic acid-binding protein
MDSRRQGEVELTPLYVVDASVAAKWVLGGEPFEENAIMLKDDYLSGIAEVCAPSLIVLEVASALWKAIKLGRILEEDAHEALNILNELGITLHELNWSEISRGLSTASKLDLTIYDASYLFLSDKMKAQIITADDKLFEKAKKHFRILHIKDYMR